MPRAIDVCDFLEQDRLAVQITNYYQEWESFRRPWLDQKREIRDYIFATDTSSTTNDILPWKNSTHVPKLCQLRDNLHANYMAALKPNDDAIVWEGDDESSEALDKREVIQSYIANKLRHGGFWTEVSKLVYDWIDYGNAIAMTEFVAEYTEVEGEKIPGFIGPKLVRVSPEDIVFNPIAASFDKSPKIIRSIKTLASLKADIEDRPEMAYMSEVFNKMVTKRGQFIGLGERDFNKNSAFAIDGFGSYIDYFKGEYVEVLEFYGDVYDHDDDKLYKNHILTVVDRSWVIRKQVNPSWLGRSNIFHVGWRLRPDNLYAMGPLDNLVGMQYRIDHLENAKADAFDLIVHPVMKVKGFVEDFDYGPGERIFTSEEGDVEFMSPDVTMLNADTQIQMYEAKMEEMAGAPKQAMGFRTPGEKTAYEVQVLENGANRIFLNKTSYLEEMFLEPVIQSMLELARRNMGLTDLVRVVDNQYGAVSFMKITKEDITAKGKIRPIGARHFARNANLVQNLTQLASSAIGQDPAVNAHISGKKMAHIIEELLELKRFDLVQDNVRVAETYETQQLMQGATQKLAEQGAPSPDANPMVQQPQGPQGQGSI
jgi:hypothetical protein